MKSKWKLFSVLVVFALVPVCMVAFAWYIGLFADARLEQNREYQEQIALVRNYNGDYHNGSLVIRDVKLRLEKLGISCRPVLILNHDETKILKVNMSGEGGCIVPSGTLPIAGELLRKIPSGLYTTALCKAHPVFALRKNLRLLRLHLGEKLTFPLVLFVEPSGEHALRQLDIQNSMQ